LKKPHKIFFAQKTTQNFVCTWPEHSTIVSSWILKSNASAAVVVAEKNVNITEYVVITL